MFKLTIAMVALLAGASALESKSNIIGPDRLISSSDTYTIVSSITNTTVQAIRSFWTNTTNGTHCRSLFESYYNLSQEIAIDIEKSRVILQEYLRDCNDLCPEPYIKCESLNNTCQTEEDCCVVGEGLQYCDNGECQRCCDDDLYCNGTCTDPEDLQFGVHPLEVPLEDEECCYGAGCCDEAELYLSDVDVCCEEGSQVTLPGGLVVDCCEAGEEYCEIRDECIATEDDCCIDGEYECNGGCQNVTLPCCTGNQTNCRFDNFTCKDLCCEFGECEGRCLE